MLIGLAISSLGFGWSFCIAPAKRLNSSWPGLMILLDEFASFSLQLITPLIAGVGIGLLFHTPFGILTELMPREDLAGVTGAFFLVRFIGSTTGLVSLRSPTLKTLTAKFSRLPIRF
jgi:hypothetical protein